MDITFVGHASLHVQTASLAFLSDPVFLDPFCEETNEIYPARTVTVQDIPDYQAIFISHRHLDHFDVPTLKLLRKDVDVFIPHDQLLLQTLHELGYQKVFPLRDFEQVDFGATRLTTTSSLNKVPEFGFVLEESGSTFWNQVDTVSSQESVDQVHRMVGNIDYLLAPWQPFLETTWQLRSDARFPFDLYWQLLHEALSVNAHVVTPGANGLRFVGNATSLNRVAFPITRQRFQSDLQQLTASKVLLTSPGDCVRLANNAVTLLPTPAPWITRHHEEAGIPDLLFLPAALGSIFDRALRSAANKTALPPAATNPWASLVSRVCLSTLEKQGQLFRDWGVVFQWIVVDELTATPFHIDFTQAAPVPAAGWNPLANLVVCTTAGLLRALEAREVSLSFMLTGGEYCVLNSIYIPTKQALRTPPPKALKEPVLAYYSPFAEALLAGSFRKRH